MTPPGYASVKARGNLSAVHPSLIRCRVPMGVMQIRPGVTLLQAIAKASEARPVPFSERLSDLQAGQTPGRIADVPPPPTSAAAKASADAKPPSPPPPGEPATFAAANQPAKPRGSVLNIVV